jgi:hypothetical protein
MKLYPFGKFILDVPDDHGILPIHQNAVLYDRAFGFILEALGEACPDGVIIDIGANVGDTAAIAVTYVNNPVLSIEGSEAFAPYFMSNQRHFGTQVSFIQKFVLPTALNNLKFSYRSELGTGELYRSEGETLDFDRFITTQEILNIAKKDFPDVCLIKSDTDGMDGFIISDFLGKINCPLFFECDTLRQLSGTENPWPSLFFELSKKAYSVIVFDNYGLPVIIDDKDPCSVLSDLSGYIHMQRGVHPIRMHYLDVWAFPPEWKPTFDKIAGSLRSRFLKPYCF